MQATYETLTALTDAFCREHLNDEYLELARDMAAASVPEATKPSRVRTAPHLGLRHRLCPWPDELPLR